MAGLFGVDQEAQKIASAAYKAWEKFNDEISRLHEQAKDRLHTVEVEVESRRPPEGHEDADWWVALMKRQESTQEVVDSLEELEKEPSDAEFLNNIAKGR